MKLATARGAREARVKIGVFPVRLFTTTMLVNVILPELLTVPV